MLAVGSEAVNQRDVSDGVFFYGQLHFMGEEANKDVRTPVLALQEWSGVTCALDQ